MHTSHKDHNYLTRYFYRCIFDWWWMTCRKGIFMKSAGYLAHGGIIYGIAWTRQIVRLTEHLNIIILHICTPPPPPTKEQKRSQAFSYQMVIVYQSAERWLQSRSSNFRCLAIISWKFLMSEWHHSQWPTISRKLFPELSRMMNSWYTLYANVALLYHGLAGLSDYQPYQ